MSVCADCKIEFDLDEGGFLWEGLVFCEEHDPEGGIMNDPQCLVCGYECNEISNKGLCDNCQNAYELGYNQAKGE